MTATLALLPFTAFAPVLIYLWQASTPSEENGTSWWVWLLLLLLLSLLVWWLLNRESPQPTTDDTRNTHATVQPPANEQLATIAPVPISPAEAPSAPVVSAPLPLAAAHDPVDNLTKIEGIGPKINNLLHESGIHTFADLAQTDVARLREILLQAGLKINDPATWPEQAALAAAGQWTELQALQDRLAGGRRLT